MLTGLLLAAGSSSRLGQPKQLLSAGACTLVQRAVRELAAVCESVIVVTGANAEEISPALQDEDCTCIYNNRWREGLRTSVLTGLSAATGSDVLIWVVDQPEVAASELVRLVSVWQNSPPGPAAAAYADVVGVPVIVPRALLAEVVASLEEDKDAGLRNWLRTRSDLATLDMPAAANDIDTPADLRRWRDNKE